MRTIRERLGLNQSEMSAKMGCDITMIKKYESGKSTVNLLYLSRAVAEVGLTLEDLLLDDGTFCKKLWF
ncbi:multiprotein-bridging factor 1 family protein [Fibrobacter sp.]|uniref:helix-turn-helix domain-containing protein n=1 Tax=Fibrobacter sp. TaxID=35828 RepID=UPI00388D4A26